MGSHHKADGSRKAEGGSSRGDIPWNAIKARWEAGESPHQISKEYPVSSEGIRLRSKREGWERSGYAAKARQLASRTNLVRETRSGSPLGMRSEENVAAILTAIQAGASEKVAAQAVGIDPSTLTGWKRADPVFSRAVQAARAARVTEKIQRIDKAGERGDWKADAYLLERMPESRGDFGVRPGGAGGVSITLNFNRDDLATGVTVDAEPVDTPTDADEPD